VGTILVALALGACVMPASREERPGEVPAAEVVYTAAVQTVVAQLTRSAAASGTPGANPTIAETSGPGPSPTEDAGPAGGGAEGEASPTRAGAEDTETPETPLEPATVTPTLANTDPKASLGEADWQDTFDNGENWFLPDDEHSTMAVEGGKLTMTAHQADRKDWWVLTWPEVDDFYLEATGVFGDCAERDRYGLIVRAPREADRGYLFALACDGRFSFWFLDTTTPQRITLIDWTASSFIQAGAGSRNRIGIKVEGSHFSLYANGSLLAEAEDDTQNGPYFGIFTGAARTVDFTVELEEIAAWNLP
jgi:hypothetical protein